MDYSEDDQVAEVRRIRAELMEKYGGFDGYLRHIREDLSQEKLEKEGWRFVTAIIPCPFSRLAFLAIALSRDRAFCRLDWAMQRCPTVDPGSAVGFGLFLGRTRFCQMPASISLSLLIDATAEREVPSVVAPQLPLPSWKPNHRTV